MNELTKEELKTKLTDILAWIENSLKTAEGFVVEQTPLYIQELLAWHFWHSLIVFSLGPLILCALAFAGKLLIRYGRTASDPDFYYIPCLFGLLVVIPIAVSVMLSNLDWLKILIAPRVWLLDHVVTKLGSL